jgi:hypothetical protein
VRKAVRSREWNAHAVVWGAENYYKRVLITSKFRLVRIVESRVPARVAHLTRAHGGDREPAATGPRPSVCARGFLPTPEDLVI